ncbi:MAG: pyridoxal-dependent decarboxylase [Actinomycetota bacterium]
MDDLLTDAASRAIRYLDQRDDRPVFPDTDAVDGLTALDEPLTDDGADAAAVLDLLDRVGGPATVATTGGRYFGFVTGGAHPVGLAAAWLTAAWDQNAAVAVMSPTAAALDRVAGRWLVDLFDLPTGTGHSFVSGTSMANTTALAAGRDRLLADAGHDVVADGLFGAPPVRVVVGQAHSSITKALGVLGLGRDRVTVAPSDEQGRMLVEQVPPSDEPTLVVAQAGNVNSGACDPFDRIADHFGDTSHWIHVDGAFGLWAAVAPNRRHLMAGVERAHSWAVDMHKWLNVTYDSAAVLVRDPADLARSFAVGAAYIPRDGRADPVHRGPDMSQRARAAETWAVLKSLGRAGVADLIERSCRHAARFGTELAAAGFTVHNDVVLNQVMVSLGDDGRTEQLLDAVAESQVLWAGGSTWNGRRVMRISVSGWATTHVDVTRSIEALIDLERNL